MLGETDFLKVELKGADGPVVALFDRDFEPYLERWRWKAKRYGGSAYVMRSTSKYVNGRSRGLHILAHRFVMGCEEGDGKIVDHINGNTLDNRKINLRLVTAQQNVWNSKPTSKTGYYGVTEYDCGFVGKIRSGGKYHYCGCHQTAEQAALAVNEKLLELRGEYSRLNRITRTA